MNSDGDTSSMESTLPIPGGGPKADTYRPNHILHKILLSFTITTQAQVLSFITGGLVTPPGCMENSSTPLDTHTVPLDITNGGWNTVATTMLDFTMKVPPFKALLEQHFSSTEEMTSNYTIGLSNQPCLLYTSPSPRDLG